VAEQKTFQPPAARAAPRKSAWHRSDWRLAGPCGYRSTFAAEGTRRRFGRDDLAWGRCFRGLVSEFEKLRRRFWRPTALVLHLFQLRSPHQRSLPHNADLPRLPRVAHAWAGPGLSAGAG